MTEQQIDATAVDPAEFARSVATTPAEQLADGMRSPLRGQILGEIFRRMTEHVRPDRIQGLDAVMHWKITGRPDGGYDHYEVVIGGGSCTLSEQPQHEPRVTFKIDGVDFLRLVTGNASGPILFTTGKLKIEGDLMFAATAAGLFKIPSAGGPAAA
jgi:putative sterol carrier protein